MEINGSKQNIIITGDITMDWNLARAARFGGRLPHGVRGKVPVILPGSAALLADLVEAINMDLQRGGDTPFSIHQSGAARKPRGVQPDSSQYHHSYTLWSPYKYGDKPAWRVESFLGLHRAAKLRNCLVLWQELRGVEKEKDRHLVRGIPLIPSRAGYAIVRSNN